MTTQHDIEAAARAIARVHMAETGISPDEPYGFDNKPCWKAFEHHARAAIAASDAERLKSAPEVVKALTDKDAIAARALFHCLPTMREAATLITTLLAQKPAPLTEEQMREMLADEMDIYVYGDPRGKSYRVRKEGSNGDIPIAVALAFGRAVQEYFTGQK